MLAAFNAAVLIGSCGETQGMAVLIGCCGKTRDGRDGSGGRVLL